MSQDAIDLGLADGIGSIESHIRSEYGDKVRINRVGVHGAPWEQYFGVLSDNLCGSNMDLTNMMNKDYPKF